jgi:SAM-dependent methyltransferase
LHPDDRRKKPTWRDDVPMQGYSAESYGDGFADVYDEWYHGVSPVDETVARLAGLVPAGARVLELGVGTGRLAIPLATALGGAVVGIDASRPMLDVLASKNASRVTCICGDMVDDLPAGPFGLAFAAYNTFFNLLSEARQQQCFSRIAERLGPAGRFVIEAFVPDPESQLPSSVTVRSVTVDRVVLSVSTANTSSQTAEGQFVDITEAGGVKMRPWSIRWATPAQLDAMAGRAGLRLAARWGGFDGSDFDADSERHVSVYQRR